MYIIEVPHQRPARGYSHYDFEFAWAQACADRADWTAPSHDPENLMEATNEQLIAWAKSDFSAVYVMLTLVEVLDRLMTCEKDHQGARIASICARWIEQAEHS